jgi:hypothetical protein
MDTACRTDTGNTVPKNGYPKKGSKVKGIDHHGRFAGKTRDKGFFTNVSISFSC